MDAITRKKKNVRRRRGGVDQEGSRGAGKKKKRKVCWEVGEMGFLGTGKQKGRGGMQAAMQEVGGRERCLMKGRREGWARRTGKRTNGSWGRGKNKNS